MTYSRSCQHYDLHKLEAIARRIWWGSRQQGCYRTSDIKWADAPSVGINMRLADFPIRSFDWQPVGEFEIFIESSVRGDFQGRFAVRRPK